MEISRNYWQALERKAAAKKPVRYRRHFSAKHIAALRKFSPAMAPVKPARSVPVKRPIARPMDPEMEARRARVRAMMDKDFGPAY